LGGRQRRSSLPPRLTSVVAGLTSVVAGLTSVVAGLTEPGKPPATHLPATGDTDPNYKAITDLAP